MTQGISQVHGVSILTIHKVVWLWHKLFLVFIKFFEYIQRYSVGLKIELLYGSVDN